MGNVKCAECNVKCELWNFTCEISNAKCKKWSEMGNGNC